MQGKTVRQGVLATTALLAGLCSAPARATVFPAVGAQGDVAEDYRCPPGRVLVGFNGRAGVWVDRIGLMCSEVLPGYRTGGVVSPPPKGGGGGEPTEQYCEPNAAIRAIDLWIVWSRNSYVVHVDEYRPEYLGAVEFNCSRPADGVVTGKRRFSGTLAFEDGRLRANGPDTDPRQHQECPGNEYATGVSIHFGKHVNALGLICGPVQISAPPPPTPPSHPAQPAPPAHHLGTGRCRTGFVWREARPGDHVCVIPASRDLVRSENDQAESRRDPNGAYGPMSCVSGYVWREAMVGDKVCVTPYRRARVHDENAIGPDRAE